MPYLDFTCTVVPGGGHPAYAEWVKTPVVAASLAVVAALGVAVAAAITTVGASEPPPAPHLVVDVVNPNSPSPNPSLEPTSSDHADDEGGHADDDDHGGGDDDD